MAIEKTIKINVESSQADSGLKALQNQLKKTDNEAEKLNETTATTSKQGNVFSKMSGGLQELVPGFSGAVAGGQNMLKTMWALVANPIGAVIAAIVLGLGLLYKAFASTNDGADKIEQTLAGLSAIVDILRDRVLKVGEALFKFFTGDLKGAMAAGKESVKGFGDEVSKEFKKARDATRYLQEVEDSLRSLGESRAKLNRDLAATKEIITDENATFAEKRKAINEVRIAEEKQTQAELENAKKKLKAIADLNKLSDTSDEDLKKESDAKIALYNIEQEQAVNRRAVRKQELTLNRQEAAEKKAIQDEYNSKLKEANDKEKERLKEVASANKKRLEELAAEREKEIADLIAFRTKMFQLESDLRFQDYDRKKQDLVDFNKFVSDEGEKEFKDKQDKIEKEKAWEESISNTKISLANNTFNLLSALAKKGSALSKALAITEIVREQVKSVSATISATTIANAKAVAASPLTLGQPFVGLNTAASIVGIAASVAGAGAAIKNILSDSKSASGNFGGQSQESSAPSAPSFNLVQGTASNQIAQSLAQSNAPIKAYVVSTDMTTNQSLDRNILNNSRIG